MTNFSKVKKKKGLGSPPAIKEVKGNLETPEVAPIAPSSSNKKAGRPKSKRTAKLTTSFMPAFKKKLQMLSLNMEKDMGEIIEEAVEFWEKNRKK